MYTMEEKLIMINQGKIVDPFAVEIHLSNICNHNCKWCIFKELNQSDDSIMPYDCAVDLVKDLHKSNCQSILFSGGGEPLTHPNIIEIIELSHSLGMSNTLITNAGLLYEYDLEILLEICDNIRISLDSHDLESHSVAHNPTNNNMDNFDKIYDTVGKLVELNNFGTMITLSYILDDASVKEVKTFIGHAIDLAVDKVDIKTEHSLPCFVRKGLVEKTKNLLLLNDPGSLKIVYDEIRQRKDIDSYKWLGLFYKCVIDVKGTLYPCCHTLKEKNKIGNLSDGGFLSVWGGNRHLEMIEFNDKQNSCCQVCADSYDAITIRRIIKKMELMYSR